MAATIATVYPAFLIGAVSVQVSDEFEVGEATYGWGLGGFFLAATAGSILGGRLAQRIGPRRQISFALGATAAIQLLIALSSTSFARVVGLLAVAGLVNSMNQSAVNLAITQSGMSRLGLLLALKQSSMPMAALISGVAVPVLALTAGWRWAYVLGAMIACLALFGIRATLQPAHQLGDATPGLDAAAAEFTTTGLHSTPGDPTAPLPQTGPSVVEPDAGAAKAGLGLNPPQRPQSAPSTLARVAVATGLLAFSAGSLTAWLVGSAVESGMSEGAAGLLLALGSGLGIVLRLLIGVRLDAISGSPFRLAASVVVVGSVGFALLSHGSPVVTVVAAMLAFGGGWTWPVLTNFGIVRANSASAAAATGITQTGVYLGVFCAPLVSGWIIARWSYGAMWLFTALVTLLGAAVSWRVSSEL